MPTLIVEGFEPVTVPSGKRLVLAIEQDAKVDVLHACGGNARCTTCRVEFVDGEPTSMTAAERQDGNQRESGPARQGAKCGLDFLHRCANPDVTHSLGTGRGGSDGSRANGIEYIARENPA